MGNEQSAPSSTSSSMTSSPGSSPGHGNHMAYAPLYNGFSGTPPSPPPPNSNGPFQKKYRSTSASPTFLEHEHPDPSPYVTYASTMPTEDPPVNLHHHQRGGGGGGMHKSSAYSVPNTTTPDRLGGQRGVRENAADVANCVDYREQEELASLQRQNVEWVAGWVPLPTKDPEYVMGERRGERFAKYPPHPRMNEEQHTQQPFYHQGMPPSPQYTSNSSSASYSHTTAMAAGGPRHSHRSSRHNDPWSAVEVPTPPHPHYPHSSPSPPPHHPSSSSWDGARGHAVLSPTNSSLRGDTGAGAGTYDSSVRDHVSGCENVRDMGAPPGLSMENLLEPGTKVH